MQRVLCTGQMREGETLSFRASCFICGLLTLVGCFMAFGNHSMLALSSSGAVIIGGTCASDVMSLQC